MQAYGSANIRLGEDIREAAALLGAIPIAAITDAFGPAGNRFAAALAGAVDQLAQQATQLAGAVAEGGATSLRVRREYVDSDTYADARISGVGT